MMYNSYIISFNRASLRVAVCV